MHRPSAPTGFVTPAPTPLGDPAAFGSPLKRHQTRSASPIISLKEPQPKKRKFVFLEDRSAPTTQSMSSPDENDGGLFQKFRVVLGYRELLEEVPSMRGEENHEFLLSKKLVVWLNKNDPELRYKDTGDADGPAKPTWSHATVLRTCLMRAQNHTNLAGDATFLRYLLKGVPESIRATGMLFLRCEATKQAYRYVKQGRRCLDLWCTSGPPDRTHRLAPRPLAAWFDWTRTSDPETAARSGLSENDLRRVSWNVFCITTQLPASSYEFVTPMDEIRCLWYMILKEQGYSTGIPDPKEVAQASDNAVSGAYMLHPLCVGSSAAVAADLALPPSTGASALDAEIRETHALSFPTFLGMVSQLHYMMLAKRACIERLWRKKMPLIAELCDAGMKETLLAITKAERSKSHRRRAQGRIRPLSEEDLDLAGVPKSPTDQSFSETMASHILNDQKRRLIKSFRV